MIHKLLALITGQSSEEKHIDAHRQLIRREAQIGGQVFGPVPADRRREFFCLDKNTWIWHEEWKESGQIQTRTTRYDIRPTGILKAQNNGTYHMVSKEEALNLFNAAKMYKERVYGELYGVSA